MTFYRLGFVMLLALSVICSATACLRAEDQPPALTVAPFDAMKARQHQESWAKHLKTEVEITNSLGQKFRLIPPGTFGMGSLPGEMVHFPDSKPQHTVSITKAYYLGQHEVTRGAFHRFVEDSHYKTDAEKNGKGGGGLNISTTAPEKVSPQFTWRNPGFEQTDKHPVVNVSWFDATEFCRWLSQKEKTTFRLPTEAEWEYACRAGTVTRWSTGADEATLKNAANVADQSLKLKNAYFKWATAWDDGFPFTSPAGKFAANPFGLHDTQGNALEWCQDWYDEKYYANSPIRDPLGPDGIHKTRVLRGGSFDGHVNFSSPSIRVPNHPSFRNFNTGFRVVRELSLSPAPRP